MANDRLMVLDRASGQPKTIAGVADHNVPKFNGTDWVSSPLGISDVLNEVYLDYTPRTTIGTTTDDAAAHVLADVRSPAAAVLGIASQNDVQTITMTATGGTFTVSYKGSLPTAAQANNVSLANLQTAIQGLSTVGAGNITVTGTAGSSYVLTASGAFAATLLDDIELNVTLLTGGTASLLHTRYGGHRLVNTDTTTVGNSAIYRTAVLTNSISFMGGEFDFGSTGSVNNLACVTLAAMTANMPSSGGLQSGIIPDIACHVNFYLNHLEIGIFQAGVFSQLFTYDYDVAFATSAYQYGEVAVDKASSSISVRAPDQTVWSISHALVGYSTARYFFHETISSNSTNQYKPQWAKVTADSQPIRINSSGGNNRTQSLITDGRSAARNYQLVSQLQFVAPSPYTGRRAKLDLAHTANNIGQTSIMYVPPRSGVILGKIGVLTSAVSVANTTTETLVIGASNGLLWSNELEIGGAGATLLIRISGSIKAVTTAGSTLTFKFYPVNVACAQTFVMPLQGVAIATAAPFTLEIIVNIRSIGATGTAIAGGLGIINPTTTSAVYISPAAGATLANTVTINTATQVGNFVSGTPGFGLTAQWGLANVGNVCVAEAGFIQRMS